MAVRGGNNLDRYFIEFERKVARGAKMRVGFLESAAPYPDGMPVATVALINEYGAPSRNVPSRPFFRTVMAERSRAWANIMAHSLREMSYDVRAVYKMIGPIMVDDIKESIVKGDWAPNAPSTVRRKGRDTPLIDQERMYNAVDYEIS